MADGSALADAAGARLAPRASPRTVDLNADAGVREPPYVFRGRRFGGPSLGPFGVRLGLLPRDRWIISARGLEICTGTIARIDAYEVVYGGSRTQADAGEGFDDAGLLAYVTSVNVACGGHVGDARSCARTVDLAAAAGAETDRRRGSVRANGERLAQLLVSAQVAAGAAIGAHVAYEDREGFGRRPMDVDPAALRDAVLFQAAALDGVCRARGARATRVRPRPSASRPARRRPGDGDARYVKPHGALYHAVMAGGAQADAVFEAAELLGLPLLLMPASPHATFGEGFAERAYDGDALRPRSEPGAVIHDPAAAAAQAVALAARPDLHTVCVHGDSPNAVAVAKAVRAALDDAGFRVAPFRPC